MRRWTRTTIVGTMAILIAATTAATAVSAEPEFVPGNPVYIALGDSWAYGQGAADPATGGYAARLNSELRERLDCLSAESEMAAGGCRRLQHLNLGRPASDVLPGVTTDHVIGEQLPVAMPLASNRNGDANPGNDVEAVTLHVGGNDVSGPIQAACLGGFTAECQYTWVDEMNTFEAGLRSIMASLRTAAGPDMPMVLGTYDNPVQYCWLGTAYGAPAVMLGAMVLEGTPDGSLDGIHDIVRRVAADFDADVAEVFGTLGSGDFVGGNDCLHLTDSGHAKVAAAFAEILES